MISLRSATFAVRLTASKTAVVLLAAFAAAGCQTNSTQASVTPIEEQEQWIPAEQAELEFQDESRKLTLAPGWKWPQERQYESQAGDGKKINYGVNSGRVDAAWYWHCSWALNYFSATSATERDAALQKVLGLKNSAFYRYGLAPEDRSSRDRILALAESGEAEQLRAIIQANCPNGDVSVPR